MTKTCLICKSESTPFQKRSMHRFPTDESIRYKWIESLELSNKTINFKTAVICSDHFDDKSFFYRCELRRRSRIRPDVVPQLTNTIKPSTTVVSEDNSQESNTQQDASFVANLDEEPYIEMTFKNSPDFKERDPLKIENCTFDSTDEICLENCNEDLSNFNSKTVNNPSNSKKMKNSCTDVKPTKVRFMTGFKTEYMCREDFSNEEAWNKFLRYSSYQKSKIAAAHNRSSRKQKKINTINDKYFRAKYM